MKERTISQIVTMEGEDDVNDWLEENADVVDIVNITMAIGRGFVDVFMIHFKISKEDLQRIKDGRQ